MFRGHLPNTNANAEFRVPDAPEKSLMDRYLKLAGISGATVAAMIVSVAPAEAAQPASLFSVCSGVSLPRSVVTGIIGGPLVGITTPIQTTVNSILGTIGGLPIVSAVLPPPPLNVDVTGLLANAASGAPIQLSVLDRNNTIIGPNAQCNSTADSIQLNTPGGIAIGGNRITGLGVNGLDATAGEMGSVALGNAAMTAASATNAVAVGQNAGVGAGATGSVALGSGALASAPNSVALGAGSTAIRGPQASYAAPGLAAAQSTGEVSVGAPGAARQITNVAPGSATTDAVNVGQFTAGLAASAAVAPLQYSTAAAPVTANPGVTSNDVTLVGGAAATPVAVHNLAPGALTSGSTDAVNGGQLATTNAIVAGNTTNLTKLSNGTSGLVQQAGGAPGNGTITIGVATGGAQVSVAGTNGTRSVTGVSAGTLSGVSTDAVNGSQLFATNSALTNLTTGVTNGTAGLVQQIGGSPGAGGITLGAATAGTNLNVAGTAGPRVVSGVGAGVAATDAVNLGQLSAIGNVAANAVQYDTGAGGLRTNHVTLAGGSAGTVGIGNLAAGTLAAGSTDAVSGGQLFTTNGQVGANTAAITTNTTAITNLSTGLGNGTVGLIQQTGGAPGTGQVTVGGTTGGDSVSVAGTGGNRVITGAAPGLSANDAATVGQLGQVTGGAFNAVNYDVDPNGGRLNSVTLAGGVPGPVRIINVAPAALIAGSTDAVNGGQLGATNAGLASILTGQAGAFRSDNTAKAAAPAVTGANATAGGFGAIAGGVQSLALGNSATSTGVGSVALGAGSTDGGIAGVVSVGAAGSERRITNVGAGLASTDAVNLGQLQAAGTQFQNTAANLQSQINGVSFDLRQVQRRADEGTAGAMAVAGLPQAFTPGAGMIAGGVGEWQGQVAFAVGASKIVGNQTVVRAGASFSTRGSGGFNAGVGYQF